MKVEFKEPRQIDGVHFKKGVHEIDDKFHGHWYLKACVINGVALIKEAPKTAKEIVVERIAQEVEEIIEESGEAEAVETAICEKPKRGRKPKA